jgi:hypothetical protein
MKSFNMKRAHLLAIAGLLALPVGAALALAAAEDGITIGVMTDMSGVLSDLSGLGSLEAVRMAVEDAGGKALGKPVTILDVDHQNKADIAMKATPVNDFFAKDGKIREDGRMVHDMYLMQVKAPSESKYPWDYYKMVATIPGDQAFQPLEKSTCSLLRKR